jgi:hypothetical protein
LVTKPAVDPALAKEIEDVARDYVSWGRIDDAMRWAPYDCLMPPPARPRMSASADATTHGQKLYSVFAKMHEGYRNPSITLAEGQIVVKESWTPERMTEPPPPMHDMKLYAENDHFYPFVQKDGEWYRAARKAGLYVMMKKKASPDTDEGWVYGTITADGVVTSAGRVESCATCHAKATHERLFHL